MPIGWLHTFAYSLFKPFMNWDIENIASFVQLVWHA